MNQILISQKVYVTKEMKRKQKIYKTLYIISVIIIIILSLYYIISERNKAIQEGYSYEIMNQIEQININDNTIVEEHTIVVALDDNSDDSQVVPIQEVVEPETQEEPQAREITASNGQVYEIEGTLSIPVIGISYPILTKQSEELLKISLCKYWGPNPNEPGNYCIVGHNYASGKMFGKLSQVNIGDTVTLKDLSGKVITYSIYNKYPVEPTDVSCTSQLTNGNRELTLITCTDYGKRRLVVKAREI